MTACVFLGPTLPVAEAREVLAADYLPPVRQGDVHRAVNRFRPRAIGIVDGCFHQVPSVWHKEILWAMAEGVHVFGSASMGALRAAELQPFGMQGVGNVFAAFRDQILEDDDEVAVAHGPEEIGFLAASEAMVNIRRTLDDAKAEAVVSAATQKRLEGIAKSLFYPWRTYPKIMKRGAAEGLPANELSALSAWLDQGRVDLKRDDTLEMLRCMRDLLRDDPPAMRAAYTFEHTTMWEAAIAQVHAGDGGISSSSERSIDDWLMDEIRLDGEIHDGLRQAAVLRLLTRCEAERRKIDVHDDELRQFATDFRLDHALHRGTDLKEWLAERDLDHRAFERLLEDKVLINKVAKELQDRVERYAIDQLRVDGDYARLVARARTKRQTLEAAEDDRDNDENLMGDLRAMAWYFEQRVGARLPDDIDAYAMRRGFRGAADFRRAVVCEFRFQLINDRARRP